MRKLQTFYKVNSYICLFLGFLVKRCEQETVRNVETRIINKSKLCSKNIIQWTPQLDDGLNPVVVFCVISSRIEVDIEAAMRGVNGNRRLNFILTS